MRYIVRKTFFLIMPVLSWIGIIAMIFISHVEMASSQSLSTPGTLNVPLLVKEVAGVGAHEYPITAVVPLTEGRYQNINSFRVVDRTGNTVPAQFEVLNRWWSKDNSLRHIAVHFQPTVSAFTGSGTGIVTYYLKDDGNGNYASAPIVLTETTSDITVNTGVLKFVVKKNNFNILDQVWLDLNKDKLFESNEQIISASPLNGGILVPRQENMTGTQYDSSRSDVTVEIEESGPMRVVIRAEALTRYISTTEHTHGWAVRIYAYAGKPYIKIDYQLQNSAKNEVYAWPLYFESLNLDFTLNMNGNPSVKFGIGDGNMYERPRQNGLYIAQKMHNIFEIRDVGDDSKLYAGTIPEGFISINDGEKGVTAMTRNFWQMWPNGLKIDAQNTLSLQLFPEWSAQFFYNKETGAYELNPTDLYWLEDMQHVYKETLLLFHEPVVSDTDLSNLAQTFQYHPVATVPIEHYRMANATLDLGGIIPDDQYLDINTEDLRSPSYGLTSYDITRQDTYLFDWDNFKLDIDRKITVDLPGGIPYGNARFIATGNPSDYFDAEDFAMGELNVRPQWMAGYSHEEDWSTLQLTENPYAGGSWRKCKDHNYPTKRYTAAPYLEGTDKDSKARDDAHGWFYHVEEAYYLTGNLWIKDWYEFIAEFRQVRLHNLDPTPNNSARAIAHALAHAMQAYRITGNEKTIQAFYDYLQWFRSEKQDLMYGVTASRLTHESVFQVGYLARAVISFMEEIRGKNWQAYAEAFQYLSGYMNWNLNYANYGYHYDTTSGVPGKSSGTGLTMVDPQLWYYWNTGKKEFFDHVNQYMLNGINGGADPYGNFEQWGGQYEGRYYLFVKNTTRDDMIPPAPITDLRAIRSGSDVVLTWTAPQNPDLERYHVVWSTKPISEIQTTDSSKSNWWAANVLGPDLAPISGTQQTLTIPSVSEGPIYVAIFTFDQQQNMSVMSNVAIESSGPIEKQALKVSKTGIGTITSNPSGIDCGSICEAEFNQGTVVTLSASPAAGSVFTGWSGACVGTDACIIVLDQSAEVSANFHLLYNLTIIKSGTGDGTVTSDLGGIVCGVACSAEYAEHAVVTLTAEAIPGSIFVGWSGSDCQGKDACVVTMDAARSITAIFDPDDGDVLFSQEQIFEFDRGGDSSIPIVYRGDTISYQITATNTFESDVSLIISDAVSALVDYVSGSLKIDEKAVSDDSQYFSGALLGYESDWLTKGQSLTISFDVTVREDALFNEIVKNSASVTAYFRGQSQPIISDKLSNVIQAQIKNPVPEPSTFLLFGTGFLGMFILIRKKFKREK